MMRYLGTGVGHRQSADFPREIGKLKKALEGEFYIQAATWPRRQSSTEPDLNPIMDFGQEDGEDLLYSDDEEFPENIYEL